MSKRWRIHEETLAEIAATVAWYETQRQGLGLEFLAELRSTLATLRAAPAAVAPDRTAPEDACVRRGRLHRFPYAVVFAESDAAYVVIAAHGAKMRHVARSGRSRSRRLSARIDDAARASSATCG